jgi:hypothetical protein
MNIVRKWRGNRVALTGTMVSVRIRKSPSAVKRKG